MDGGNRVTAPKWLEWGIAAGLEPIDVINAWAAAEDQQARGALQAGWRSVAVATVADPHVVVSSDCR